MLVCTLDFPTKCALHHYLQDKNRVQEELNFEIIKKIRDFGK